VSKLEQMAYKMQPAGHEEPPKRRNYAKADTKLRQIFETWLNGDYIVNHTYHADEMLEDAQRMLKGIKATPEELHALLIPYQDHPRFKLTGLFLTGFYNVCRENEIHFDVPLEEEIDHVGYRLAENKILINKATMGYLCGEMANGNIINYGTVGNSFCLRSDCKALNYGTVQDLGNLSSLFVNMGLTFNVGTAIRAVIDYGQIKSPSINGVYNFLSSQGERPYSPQARKKVLEYLSNLKLGFEKGKTDHKAAIKALNDISVDKIVQDYHKMVYGELK